MQCFMGADLSLFFSPCFSRTGLWGRVYIGNYVTYVAQIKALGCLSRHEYSLGMSRMNSPDSPI